MSTDEILNDYKAFSERGAAFVEIDLSSVSIKGPAALDFLQRMTSQDLRNLPAGAGIADALLTSTGLIAFLFDVVNLSGTYWLFGSVGESSPLIEALEKFHFVEDLEIQGHSSEFKFFQIFGNQAENILSQSLGFEAVIFRGKDLGQNQSYTVRVSRAYFVDLKKKLVSLGIAEISQETFRLLNLEAGGAEFGKDIKPRSLVLEAPLENHVSRVKGCYPGQEVVERVFTYGNVAKKIVGLKFLSSPPNIKLLVDAKLQTPDDLKDVGVITSSVVIPWTQKTIGRALLKKPSYHEGQKLLVQADGISYETEVYELPNSFKISSEKVRV